MSEAIDFFKNEEIAQTKCSILQQNPSQSLAWEKEKVSIFSPAIVSDDETIVRSWYVPIHIDTDTGELKPTAFDDASSRGLSVNRNKYETIKKIQKNAIKQAIEVSKTRTPRDYHGYSTAKVSDIRSHTIDDIQIFAVYDTSIDSKKGISHADTCALLSHDPDKNLTKKTVKKIIRGRLSGCFSDIVPPEKETSLTALFNLVINFFRG